MKFSVRHYIWAGLPFIFIGLLFNPWLISWLFALSFPTTIISGILFISIILIIIGWGIIFKKDKALFWLQKKHTEIALIVLNLLILLGLLNFISAIVLYKPIREIKPETYYFDPIDLVSDSIKFLREIYPDKSDAEIRELVLFRTPYSNHPVLEYQEKVQDSYAYKVGFEGIRFDKNVNLHNVDSVINRAVWVFGGSTTFGHGVKANETITWFLNKLDTTNLYINFGVHGYFQSNEIEKLELLLKKGYTPSRVIFIDGLNDLTRMIETNYHPMETPALAKNAYSSDYNISTKQTGNFVFKQLPVTRLLRSLMGEEKGPKTNIKLPWTQYDSIYNPDDLYHLNPKQHYQSTVLRSPYNEIDTAGLNYIIWKLELLYKQNYSYLEKISDAFGFAFSIYYQPIGILNPQNPFWKDKNNSTSTPLYRNFAYIVPKIREKLRLANYQFFTDISNVDDSCSTCYVDLFHYNADLNQLIAKAILENTYKTEKEDPVK